MREMIKFVLVDDHPVVREGMEAMLSSEEGYYSLGTAADLEQAMELCEKGNPHILLTDVRMPEHDGFDVVREARSRFPELRILMLAGMPIVSECARAKELGANGYVSKSAPLELLLKFIRQVRRDPNVFVEDVTENSPDVVLSPREVEVLKCLSKGLERKDIAARLGISPDTVKWNVGEILKKMDVNNATEAVAKGLRAGLIR